MAALRSLAYFVIFYAGSAAIVLATLFALPFGRPGVYAAARIWARFHRFCTRAFLGIRAQIQGVPPIGPALIAVKHEAMYETIEILLSLENPAIVFKAELLRIPLWGRIARLYGVIPVDREGGAASMRALLGAARAAVNEGRSILIYPEGTRVLPGRRPPLRSGFAGLYKALNLPVVPVAVDSGRLWRRGQVIKRGGIVTIRFGDPIPPGLDRVVVETRVHDAINLLNR